MAKNLWITKGLQDTLLTLRGSGFILALISGGIDTFIEELIPNAADLFDYICINRLEFEKPSGLVSSIVPTPFDFAGKAAALEAICIRHGCTLKQAVYVGEGLNDAEVVKAAGMSIAYPPGDATVDAASRVEVKEDDLSKILEHVL
jgi:phosphoserine phosphatase